jgi:hypothetical protein
MKAVAAAAGLAMSRLLHLTGQPQLHHSFYSRSLFEQASQSRGSNFSENYTPRWVSSGWTSTHQTIASFASQQFDCPLIFDLWLDLFNRSGDRETGSLWSDAEVTDFLKSVEPLLQAAEIVTVSLSFGYSGTEEDTRRLAHLVCPRIMASRSKH